MSKNTNQYKIAIIGPADVVSGFRALGVESFSAHNADEALAQLKNIKQLSAVGSAKSAYAVVCIIEDLMIDMDEKEYSRVMKGSFRQREEVAEGETESLAKEAVDSNPSASYLPAVVILPGTAGSQGFAEARLRKLSEKAIGAAII